MSIHARLAAVQAGLRTAERIHQRAAGSVNLLAVSKTHALSAVRTVAEAGQLHFGESYGQELRDKGNEAPELCWHFIGRLQRNKLKYVAKHAQWVHSLTHIEQAEGLEKRAPRRLKVLININLGDEASKTGLEPHKLPALLDALAPFEKLNVVGLMCIPPFTEDPNDAGPFFAQLAHLAKRETARGHALPELSMGMTRDYPLAVEHGATWVRVGTAIFGPRAQV